VSASEIENSTQPLQLSDDIEEIKNVIKGAQNVNNTMDELNLLNNLLDNILQIITDLVEAEGNVLSAGEIEQTLSDVGRREGRSEMSPRSPKNQR